MVKSKVKYIEKYPISREIIFDSSNDFYRFYEDYLNELKGKNIEWFKWEREYFKINKDGTKRKYNPAKHLQSPENKKKALINFKTYQRRRSKQVIKNNKILRDKEEEIKNLLKSSGYDLGLINVEIKSRRWKRK